MAKPTKQMMNEHDMTVLNKLEGINDKQFKSRAVAILAHKEFKKFSILDQLEMMSRVKKMTEERFKLSPESFYEMMRHVGTTARSIQAAITENRRVFTDQVMSKMEENNEYSGSRPQRAQAAERINKLIENLGDLKKSIDVRQDVFAENTTINMNTISWPGEVPKTNVSQGEVPKTNEYKGAIKELKGRKNPDPAIENKPKILVYTDFDGTITGKPGNQAVFSNFYRSLFLNSPDSDKYNEWPIRDSAVVQASFKAQYDNPTADKTFFMSHDAIAFFKHALTQPDCRVNIITKNRGDYVKELFKFHGFSEQEIDRLHIDSSGRKDHAVTQDLQNINTSQVEGVFVLDDSLGDFNAMQMTVQNTSFEKKPWLVAHNEGAGQFNWKGYVENITNPNQVGEERLNNFDEPGKENMAGPSI